MTVSFIEGFDHLAVGDLTEKWNTQSGIAKQSIVAGRTGNCLRFSGVAATNIKKVLDASKDIWIVGFAIRVDSVSDEEDLLGFEGGGSVQCYLTINPDLTISLHRAQVGSYLNHTDVRLATSVSGLLAGVWHYLECKITIGNSPSGACEVRVDGSSSGWINEPGIDTQYNSATVSTIMLGIAEGNATLDIDDLYVIDPAAGPNNNFLGDCKVETIRPSGAGATTDFTIGGSVPAATNWESTDETTPDEDVTDVYSSTLNHIDTYAFTNLSAATATIKAVQVNIIAKKDDAGDRSIAPVVRPVATNRVGSDKALSLAYSDMRQVYDTSPETGVAWTVSEINGSEFGAKVTV